MRVIVTGASGFVGSNIAKVLRDRHGDEVIDRRVDMTDPAAVADHVTTSGADAVIHCAILNDWDRMHADRREAWAAYVDATRFYADAAAAADIPMCVISTDWVFDGTQSNATEDTPPNPINLYGFLKAASELVALERGGAVVRVMGVNGTHWARPATPRAQ
ncbi:MAG: sugar nucleotide-binding protein, partial [Actinomycetota bacterium]